VTRRSVLVSVYGSGNLLAAMASVRWNGEQSGRGEADRVVVLVHPPVPSAEMVRANGEVVERLIASQGWPAPIVLTGEDVAQITRESDRFARYADVLARFRERVGDGFDEIHYAHDMVGRVPELAMNAFPDAERIMYGDTLGSVYDPHYFMALAAGATIAEARREARERPRSPRGPLPRAIARGVREVALGGPQAFAAYKALLVLPMDQTGEALAGTPVSVVPKQVVTRIVSECQRVVPRIADYGRAIASDTPAPRFLLLLENYADADMTSFEDEVSMYEAIVRAHVPQGGTLLLKSHPLAVAPVADALCERLDSAYSVLVVPRDELARYPMELWSDLIASCEIISMLSYCGISLSFLYGKQTIYPMDAGIVERFFPERSWERMKDSDALYRGQLDALATWDGMGVLWKGTLQ